MSALLGGLPTGRRSISTPNRVSGYEVLLPRILRWDSTEPDDTVMEFRLTYVGPLLASNTGQRDTKPARVGYKHRLRRHFHRQLKELWRVHPALAGRSEPERLDAHANNWRENGFRYAPLVNREWGLVCTLEFSILRQGPPGYVINTADVDNRVKTLLDVLRKPTTAREIGDAKPRSDEDPFFVLLEDDRLVTRMSVASDTLLNLVSDEEWRNVAQSEEETAKYGPEQYGPDNFARVDIAVNVRAYYTSVDNADFDGA